LLIERQAGRDIILVEELLNKFSKSVKDLLKNTLALTPSERKAEPGTAADLGVVPAIRKSSYIHT
jgi:hypothetical protein